MNISRKVLEDARKRMSKELDEARRQGKAPTSLVLPEEHKMFIEKCMQLFERQIPGLQHREKRLATITEEIAKLGDNYPRYQFYLALSFAADDMLLNMRELMMAELEQKARGGSNGKQGILKN